MRALLDKHWSLVNWAEKTLRKKLILIQHLPRIKLIHFNQFWQKEVSLKAYYKISQKWVKLLKRSEGQKIWMPMWNNFKLAKRKEFSEQLLRANCLVYQKGPGKLIWIFLSNQWTRLQRRLQRKPLKHTTHNKIKSSKSNLTSYSQFCSSPEHLINLRYQDGVSLVKLVTVDKKCFLTRRTSTACLLKERQVMPLIWWYNLENTWVQKS